MTNQINRLRALRRFIATERPDVIIYFLSNVNVAAIIASVSLGICNFSLITGKTVKIRLK